MKVAQLMLLFLALVCSCVLAQSSSGVLEFGGYARSYMKFTPETHGDKPLPLVIALHGRFGTGMSMARLTGLNTIAEQEDFIVLYPDGLEGEWNYVRGIPGYPSDGPDDTAFLAALVKKISAEHTVDAQRLYVAGFSNGGFMAERLACAAPERYAAFASVAASGFGGMELVCPGQHPIRLLFIHGTYDTNIPWNGLTRQVGGRAVPILYSVPDTLAFWADHIGCSSRLEITDLPTVRRAPKTEVHRLEFTDCPENAALELYAVGKGGHNWPGRPGLIPESIAGTVSAELDASRVIWDFFSTEE